MKRNFSLQIYNGLFAREDWDSICRIPVGAIPQGSGNGLARSLAHFKKWVYYCVQLFFLWYGL